MEFIESIYGKLVLVAGAVATAWGLAKAVGALKVWMKNRASKLRERRALPQKTLDAMLAMQKEMNRRNVLQDQLLASIEEKVAAISAKQDFSNEQIATMQNEKLCWAYMYYGKRQNPIPLQTKLSLERMHTQYKDAGGRNHIPDDWKSVMDSAPVEGSR